MFRRAQAVYLLQESLSGFRRRKLTTGVTVLIMGAALLVLALFTIVAINLGSMLENARSGIDLRVFLWEEPSMEDQFDLQTRLLAIPGVKTVVYISKEYALREFRAELGDDADLLEILDQNPLPASFHMTLTAEARTGAQVREIRDEIAPWPSVSDIAFGQGWVEILERWIFLFRMATLLVGLVVFVSAVFVISNTVKLTVASSARVIEVMKLVGATNSFIRTPFLLEGVIEGLCGGILAMLILGGIFSVLSPEIDGLIFFSPLQVFGFIWFCVCLGLIGSWAAMRKYLKM